MQQPSRVGLLAWRDAVDVVRCLNLRRHLVVLELELDGGP